MGPLGHRPSRCSPSTNAFLAFGRSVKAFAARAASAEAALQQAATVNADGPQLIQFGVALGLKGLFACAQSQQRRSSLLKSAATQSARQR